MNQYIICHHGIVGQKWGVRRYQNEDGTLTAEGQKRYGDFGSKDSEYASLSNQEMQDYITRRQLEKRYDDAVYDTENSKYDREKKAAEEKKKADAEASKKRMAAAKKVVGTLAIIGTALAVPIATGIAQGKYEDEPPEVRAQKVAEAKQTGAMIAAGMGVTMQLMNLYAS